jgi:Zn-dependent metalloprotease
MKGLCMNSLLTKTMCILVAALVTSYAAAPNHTTRVRGSENKGFQSYIKSLKSLRIDDFGSLDGKGIPVAPNARRSSNAMDVVTEVTKTLNQSLKPGMRFKPKSPKYELDHLGLKHIRYNLFFNDIEVIGSSVNVTVDPDNRILDIIGKADLNLDVARPATVISPEKSLYIALAAYPEQTLAAAQPAEMVIFKGVMAYRVIISSTTKNPSSYLCFIDAARGVLLLGINRVMPAGPSQNGEHTTLTGLRLMQEGGEEVNISGWHDFDGNYFMYNKDKHWGIINERTQDWEQRPTASWGSGDPSIISLAANITTVQNWVYTTLGRKGFDDNDPLVVLHAHFDPSEADAANAHFDPSNMQFYFGSGDGIQADPLTSLDIVAHEYCHAITFTTSGLAGLPESGALNESYSDIMACLVEFASQPDNRSEYPQTRPGTADWLCGEDCALKRPAFRDVRNPQRLLQPSFYEGANWDNEMEVHINDGVQNFAFYLLSEGGTGINDGHPYSINGIGIQKAGELALYANIYFLQEYSLYRDSRNAWIQAAEMVGVNPAIVSDVWTAVGIPPLEKKCMASATDIDFGATCFGVTATRRIVLENKGGDTTTINSLTINNPHYTVAATLPVTIAPLSTYRLPITFSTTGAQIESGWLTINGDAIDNPEIVIALSGYGVPAPVMSFSPQQINVTVTSGAAADVQIRFGNSGASNLQVALQAVSGDNDPVSWLTFNPGQCTIEPGAEQLVTIHLDATALFGGICGATIRVTHNDPAVANPVDIPVSMDVNGARLLSCLPSVLTFAKPTYGQEITFTKHTLGGNYTWCKKMRPVDLDRDGTLDIMTAVHNLTTLRTGIEWFDNSADGNWRFDEKIAADRILSTCYFTDFVAKDFDGDGDVDIIATMASGRNGRNYSGTLAWYERSASGKYSEHVLATNAVGFNGLAVVDIDQDGDDDLAVINFLGFAWYENKGGQSFVEHSICQDGTLFDVRGLTCGDIDGDGDSDFLIDVQGGEGTLTWFENVNKGQSFTTHLIENTHTATYFSNSALFDFDKDGDRDIITLFQDAGVLWYENLGQGVFSKHILYAQPGICRELAVCDMDLDGDSDFVIEYKSDNHYVTAWLENRGAQQTPVQHIIISGSSYERNGIAAADFDGDQDPDLVITDWDATSRAYNIIIMENSCAANAGDIRLTNNGAMATTISSISSNNPQFLCLAAKPLVVPPQNSVVIKALYRPAGSPNTAGALTITSNATDNPSLNVQMNGPGIQLPGRIQAEDYNEGGEGKGYHDLTKGNTGGATYRSDDVDIAIANDADGGYHVGWIQAGEWLEYTVDVSTTGKYALTARMASASAGTKTLTVLVDNVKAGAFNFSDASGWQSWKNAVVSNVNLAAGRHTVRMVMTTGSFNLNYLDVALLVVPQAPTDLNATAISSSQINLRWVDNADNETGYSVYQSTASTKPGAAAAALAANTTAYNALGLSASATYNFWVCAYNGNGAGGDATVTAATPGGIGSERLANTTFAASLNGWTTQITAPAAGAITWNAYNGGQCYANMTAKGTNRWDSRIYQDIDAKSGKTYTVSVDLRLSAAGSQTVYLVVEKNGTPYTKYIDKTITVTSANFTNFTGQFTAATAEQVRVQVMFGAANGNVRVDNFSMIEK